MNKCLGCGALLQYDNPNIEGYTSKKDSDVKSHGLGLWEVRKVLKKNDNLNLFTTKTNDFFTQQLEIYN